MSDTQPADRKTGELEKNEWLLAKLLLRDHELLSRGRTKLHNWNNEAKKKPWLLTNSQQRQKSVLTIVQWLSAFSIFISMVEILCKSEKIKTFSPRDHWRLPHHCHLSLWITDAVKEMASDRWIFKKNQFNVSDMDNTEIQSWRSTSFHQHCCWNGSISTKWFHNSLPSHFYTIHLKKIFSLWTSLCEKKDKCLRIFLNVTEMMRVISKKENGSFVRLVGIVTRFFGLKNKKCKLHVSHLW